MLKYNITKIDYLWHLRSLSRVDTEETATWLLVLWVFSYLPAREIFVVVTC
jgi:hypothetical protein